MFFFVFSFLGSTLFFGVVDLGFEGDEKRC
jgi:hypothetical protein